MLNLKLIARFKPYTAISNPLIAVWTLIATKTFFLMTANSMLWILNELSCIIETNSTHNILTARLTLLRYPYLATTLVGASSCSLIVLRIKLSIWSTLLVGSKHLLFVFCLSRCGKRIFSNFLSFLACFWRAHWLIYLHWFIICLSKY